MPDPSPPPALRSDAVRNHERIMLAAHAAIAEHGAAVALDDVARRAGVGLATLYRRFPGRQALVRAVFERCFVEEIEPVVRTASMAADPWTGLVSGLEGTVATVVDNRALFEAAWDCAAITPEVLARFLEPLGQVLRAAQEVGAARPDLGSEDIPALVTMAVATMSGSPAVASGAWRRYLDVIVDGMRAGDRSTPHPQ